MNYTFDSKDLKKMSSEIKDSAKVILEHKNAQIPQRATSGSVGYDLKSVEDVIIPSRGRKLVNTGIKIQVPLETYGRIAPFRFSK